MQARAAIYLDANAGAPLSEAARAAVLSLLCESRAEAPGHFSGSSARAYSGESAFIPNPSSSHSLGRQAKGWLRQARTQVAASLGNGVHAEDIVFVSSGTEASQMAIRSVLEPLLDQGLKPHWILSAGDHEAHRQMVTWLEKRGGTARFLPLNAQGSPDATLLNSLIRSETALVSCIWVNNETGVIAPVEVISEICSARKIPLHLDGAQAWGKIPIQLAASNLAQYVSFSGHKIGALAGTGVLWRAPGLSSRGYSILPGKQESGLRGGTENLLGAVSLGAAASALTPGTWQAALEPLRDRLEREILSRISGTSIYGSSAQRVANTVSLGFEGVEKDGLVAQLDLAGYCVSSGSACSSGMTEPSHVLMSMGVSPARARSAVRVSLCSGTHWEELAGFVDALEAAVEKARRAGQPAKVR